MKRLSQRSELVVEREKLPPWVSLFVFSALSLAPSVVMFTLGGLGLSFVLLTGIDVLLLEDVLLLIFAELLHCC